MVKYDEIVVGSGISGLTMALLLGLQGHKVLLLEKAPIIGGSLARFYRKGIPFDTGFHFTGGFGKTRTLHDMQIVLGIDDDIHPIFFEGEKSNEIFFEDSGRKFEVPPGFPGILNLLIKYFPDEEEGIRTFFKKTELICKKTPMLDLREIGNVDGYSLTTALDEDFISLTQVVDQIIQDSHLKAILSLYCLCYGTKPEEVSFATHSRISLWLFESIARVDGGGDAFISAFRKQFKKYNIDIRTKTCIESFSNLSGKRADIARLNTGDDIHFENCIMAIHPKEIIKILPPQIMKKGFKERVNDFEESNGFFSVYGYLENFNGNFNVSIKSILPSTNLNKILDPGDLKETSLVVITSNEIINGENYKIVNAFEPSFYENVSQFDSNNKRSPKYEKYKKLRAEKIIERILYHFPEYKGHFRTLESASMLTFKDYLHSPFGSAYGIKQKVGQFNLLGRLPLRNLFAVGQSALLPGLVGGMMSSFAVFKSIIGKSAFQKIIEERLNEQ